MKILEESHNISDEDQEDRTEWQELIKELPEDAFEKQKADIVFFVGCVASFFPMVQKIPANMAKIIQSAGVDFTILGGEEWCCGFPLIGAGMPEKLEAMKEHNLKKVRRWVQRPSLLPVRHATIPGTIFISRMQS